MAKLPIRESRRGREGILVRAREANGEIRWPAYRLHTRGGGRSGCWLVAGSRGTSVLASLLACVNGRRKKCCHAGASPQKKPKKQMLK